MITFERVFPYLLEDEGGYVNDPVDRGGATNKGVIQRTYDAYRRLKKLPFRSVRFIEDHEVSEIYKTKYWDKVRADELPNWLRYTVFDVAVNSGPRKAIEILQQLAGVKVDGKIGPITLGASERVTLSDYSLAREQLYLDIIRRNPSQVRFKNGWLRRVKKVHNRTINLINEHV